MKGWTLAVSCVVVLALAACRKSDGKLKVTGIEPRSGDVMGGQMVAISGEGFRSVTRNVKVYFGDRTGEVTRIGDEEIIVRAPGGNAGDVVDVLVMFEPGGELKVPKAFSFFEKDYADVDDLGSKKK